MGEEQEQKFHQLTEEPVSRMISHLAVPCIISMLVTAFYNMADTFFVGMLRSNAATGAVGVVFSMMAVIQAVGFFFGHGSGNFISRELGRRNTDSASNMAATGFFSALFTGLLICVFGEIFLTPLAAFLGSSPTILPYAKDYLRVILIGAPWMTASLVLNNQLRFQGNAIYGTIITDEGYWLGMFDKFRVSILPVACLTIYCLVAWKLLPKRGTVNAAEAKEVKETKALPKAQETLVYVVFIAVMAVLVLNKWTGKLMYVAPALGVLVLIYGKALSVPEVTKALTADMIFLMAGVLGVATAMTKSGAGDLIGNAILGVLGGHPSSLAVMFLFSTVCIIMTTLMSNSATSNILYTVGATVCLAGGWDPRGIMLIVAIANVISLGFPSGAAETALIYAAGNYKVSQVAKFTVPYILIAIVTISLSANFFFPIYG